ncbi:DUF456 domain-containing protein [Halapricum desulfuricans]|uniref:Uncharacterized membrane protein, DUF456 family n=1 Tax=Halapricum desulfuricans TaxID=2841257 RepID=A0A897NAD7_9EURY|nr:DUF456 domain-containing protein [Halapricum desulfuricans]QSG07969.1 Uncharacterized membrane protein, DUF456 family [Halapricum desulfuricans]
MIRDPTILTPLIRGVPIPDPFVVVAFALLIAGVVFSVVPLLPGPILSVGGVLVYWWATGDPGWLALAALLAVGVAAVLVDWLGGAAAAKGSGVSTRVSLLAGVVGLAGTVVAGPVGLLVGVAGTVFLASYAREREAATGIRTAAYATAGVLGTVVVQTLLTGSVLVTVAVIALL